MVAAGRGVRVTSEVAALFAATSARTGATFIAFNRARTSGVRPGKDATGVKSGVWSLPTRRPEYATSPSVVASTSPGRSESSNARSWRKTGGIVAVAGTVGAQRLPIGKGVFAIGVAFAACGIGVVDAGAEEHFGRARRTEGLARLPRRGGAAHQRKIFAVATAHAEGRPRACDNRARRRWLRIIVEKIAEKRVLVLLPLAAAEKEIEQAFSRTHLGRQRHGANDGGSNEHATQLVLKGKLGTQRLLQPTRRTSLAARGTHCKSSHLPKSWTLNAL